MFVMVHLFIKLGVSICCFKIVYAIVAVQHYILQCNKIKLFMEIFLLGGENPGYHGG